VPLSSAGRSDGFSLARQRVSPASFHATWRDLTRLEATGLALLPGGDVGAVESYAQVTLMPVVAEGEAFGLNLGAPVQLQLAGGELGVGNELALGLGQSGARHLDSGQVRWRFGHKPYALAKAGTLLFPEADGALRPGAIASLGLGVDNAR
jgi:hypothetical protein